MSDAQYLSFFIGLHRVKHLETLETRDRTHIQLFLKKTHIQLFTNQCRYNICFNISSYLGQILEFFFSDPIVKKNDIFDTF